MSIWDMSKEVDLSAPVAPTLGEPRSREKMRGTLGILLTVTLAVVMLLLIIGPMFGRLAAKDAIDLAGVLVPPLIAVVGTIAGFYFGSKK